MIQQFKTLDKTSVKELLTFNRGIERETLRVTDEGLLVNSTHPETFGSKLTHPNITTDFSESQLELITPVHKSSSSAIANLGQIHRYLYSQLEDELLWSASMPCTLPNDESIPLAHYGNSNLGRLKTTYRRGLGYRYGRAMQTICAVHYNFSFSDGFWRWLKSEEQSSESEKHFKTRRYFDLMRNFRRQSWLLIYLFGASPVACNSFIKGRKHDLANFDSNTLYLPHATSLRSSNLGYQSHAQTEHLEVCYNSLDSYVSSLASGICENYPPYEKIGVQINKQYRQINTSILQSEAEFYSTIRAKCVPSPGENFLVRLLADGVQYVEIRLLDINPYFPLGIDEKEIDFLDTFLLYCLLTDSPDDNELLCNEVEQNTTITVNQGRSPKLRLQNDGVSRSLKDWGANVLAEMTPYANVLDQTFKSKRYSEALKIQLQRIADPNSTPSGQIIKDMRDKEMSFIRFALNQTMIHRDAFRSRPLSRSELKLFTDLAAQSAIEQHKIEASNTKGFDHYLRDILAIYKNL